MPSRWKKMASRMRCSTSSTVSPTATQSGKSGEYAPYERCPFSLTTNTLAIKDAMSHQVGDKKLDLVNFYLTKFPRAQNGGISLPRVLDYRDTKSYSLIPFSWNGRFM